MAGTFSLVQFSMLKQQWFVIPEKLAHGRLFSLPFQQLSGFPSCGRYPKLCSLVAMILRSVPSNGNAPTSPVVGSSTNIISTVVIVVWGTRNFERASTYKHIHNIFSTSKLVFCARSHQHMFYT